MQENIAPKLNLTAEGTRPIEGEHLKEMLELRRSIGQLGEKMDELLAKNTALGILRKSSGFGDFSDFARPMTPAEGEVGITPQQAVELIWARVGNALYVLNDRSKDLGATPLPDSETI
jgi:hypothetical protein